MPKYDKYKQSNYVQKSDIETPKLLTIRSVEEKDVSMTDQPAEMKYVIHFEENIKPWVPGISMLEMIHQINGSGETNDWHGTKIILYVDPTVSYRGKLTGGIRCRAPKNSTQSTTENSEWPEPSGIDGPQDIDERPATDADVQY